MRSVSSLRVFTLFGSISLVAAIITACGGTTSSPSADADAGASDGGSAASDARGGEDGGMVVADAGGTDASSPCIELPAEGSDCTAGQVSCDRVDLCCARAAACDSTTKKWKLSGMECLQCQMHPCGDKNCGGAEMCLARASGVSGGSTSYECAPYPAECAREWTCACVEMHLPGGCALSPNGCSATELPVKLQCMGI